MELQFTPRERLYRFEWDNRAKQWNRPDMDRADLKKLSERSSLNGLLRVGLFLGFLIGSAGLAVWALRVSPGWAIPAFFLYYFFYGFWVAIGHELQHKIAFGSSLDWFSEILFFIVQTFMWHSPRYARVSHRLHHRYTMVRGIDPETAWPEVITRKWVRMYLLDFLLKVLIVGAVVSWGRAVYAQLVRIAGRKDAMMRDHCTPGDLVAIRIESLAILLLHAAVLVAAVLTRRWEWIALITLAWQIGSPIESLWHSTEHIGRLYNMKDQRLCTRSIRVSPFIHLLYWGLDDHVDHHLFPAVPSRNLPQLHRLLRKDLPEPRGMIGCWAEIFAIAREKERNPLNEYVPMALPD